MSLLDCSDEFERLLNIVNSSLAESFKHNFHQVVDDIIELARENDKKQIKEFLGFLEADDSEDEEIECSLGMYMQAFQPNHMREVYTECLFRGVRLYLYFTQHLLPVPCIIYNDANVLIYTC